MTLDFHGFPVIREHDSVAIILLQVRPQEVSLGGGSVPANNVAGLQSLDDVVQRGIVGESVEVDEFAANGDGELVLRDLVGVVVLFFFLGVRGGGEGEKHSRRALRPCRIRRL